MASNKRPHPTHDEAYQNLRLLIGKEWIYRSCKFFITDVTESADDFRIHCSDKIARRVKPELSNQFINELYPVDKKQELEIIPNESTDIVALPTNKSNVTLVSANSAVLAEISQGLIEKFRALRAKPTKETIDSANAMIGISTAVTNLAKLELQALKMTETKS